MLTCRPCAQWCRGRGPHCEWVPHPLRRDWLWQKKGPGHLPLYLLLPYDLRAIAKTICCHQDIAADSCFTLGMLAHVELAREETWRYRHLFWGCGMLGQALYLEAEAAGVRSTGIGCYFDDEMHGLLGIDDERWQSSVSLHGRRSRRRHASRYVAAVPLSALMLPGSRCQRACRRLS